MADLSLARRRKRTNAVALVLAVCAAALGLFFLASILWTLLSEGLGVISPRIFLESTPPPGDSGGLANAILGSVLMTVLAVVISNTAVGGAFLEFWEMPAEIGFGASVLSMPLVEWVNQGLLTIFFLVVGLEIKRELTVGRLATPRAAAPRAPGRTTRRTGRRRSTLAI